MLSLRFDTAGSLDNLHVADLTTPRPGPGEVLVRVRAASINPSDVKNVQGKMAGTTTPRTPGRDFAGTVEAAGPGVPPAVVGTDVFGTGGDVGFTRDGTHAQYLVVPAAAAAAKPPRLSMAEAASVGTNFLTAYLGLIDAARVGAGEVVLITGAIGGVGGAVAHLSKWKGATTIGVVRAAISAERASEGGLDHVIDTSDSSAGSIPEQVKAITGGRGADVAYDTVGGPLFEPCIQSLGVGGRQCNIAATGERRVGFDLLDFYRRRLTLFGIDSRATDAAAAGAILAALVPGFESGELKPAPVAKTFDLARAVEAYREVDRGAEGKIVLTP